jgi:hypothetical protein
MYKYNCFECNYKTNLKGDYKRHLNSKKHQRNMGNTDCNFISGKNQPKEEQKRNKKEQKGTFSAKKGTFWDQKGTKKEQKGTFCLDDKIEEIDTNEKLICKYCNKTYATRKTLLRHMRQYCKKKGEYEAKEKENNKNIIELKKIISEEMAVQNNKISKLLDNVNTTNNTMNNSGNHNNSHNQVNNIQLNVFGKEDLSMITENVKQELIKGPFKMMPKLMEMIYFNKDHPENHTMKLVNKKEKIMKIHDKEGWKYVDKNETIDYILEDKNYAVDSYYDTNEANFSNFVKKTYGRFRELFDSRDNELWKQITKDIDLVLWNNM